MVISLYSINYQVWFSLDSGLEIWKFFSSSVPQGSMWLVRLIWDGICLINIYLFGNIAPRMIFTFSFFSSVKWIFLQWPVVMVCLFHFGWKPYVYDCRQKLSQISVRRQSVSGYQESVFFTDKSGVCFNEILSLRPSCTPMLTFCPCSLY